MKKKLKLPLAVIICLSILISCKQSESTKSVIDGQLTNRELYQLKVYSFDSLPQLVTTEEYLKNAFLPALHNYGFKNIGVFKSKKDTANPVPKLYLLIAFANMDKWLNIEEKLRNDPDYHDAGGDYIKASHEKPPFNRIESVLMQAFGDMPIMQTPNLTSKRSERVYELRSYEGPTEDYYHRKVKMFNEGGEIKLFNRLGFNAVFFAEVLSGSKMPNLVYMTTFENQAIRDSLWNEFGKAPEWIEMKDIPKYRNTVSHADILFLEPTDYSDY